MNHRLICPYCGAWFEMEEGAEFQKHKCKERVEKTYSKHKKTLHQVRDLMMTRAFNITCSCTTAWNQWMSNNEKDGYSFEEIIGHLFSNSNSDKEVNYE